jgi:hypothetical protein
VCDIFGREQGNRLVCSDKANNILPRKGAEKSSIDRRLVQASRILLSVLEHGQQGFRVGIVVPYDSGEKFEFSLSGEHGLSIAPRGAGVKF